MALTKRLKSTVLKSAALDALFKTGLALFYNLEQNHSEYAFTFEYE